MDDQTQRPLQEYRTFNDFVYHGKKIIGTGMSCKVYKGMNVKTGETVAIKHFRREYARNFELVNSEIEHLKTLKHPNIIAMLSHHYLPQSHAVLIVFEYCSYGSLYEAIELYNGLQDDLLLAVLDCLWHGLEFMRSKDLVHRDIKPGNIMLHMTDQGEITVKLGDVGTAKRVHDDETFSTLCGTPEYLHPDMQARLVQQNPQSHLATVDLWSVAVTLFHAAANSLPFIITHSKSRQENYIMVHNMYKKRKPCYISGRQRSEKLDDIEWSNKLPETCKLSPMLKSQLEKLILGLMTQGENAWNYDRFFAESKKIVSRKRVPVFFVPTGRFQFFYVDEALSYDAIEAAVIDLFPNFSINSSVSASSSASSSSVSLLANSGLYLMTANRILSRNDCSIRGDATSAADIVHSVPIQPNRQQSRLWSSTVFACPSNMADAIDKIELDVALAKKRVNIKVNEEKDFDQHSFPGVLSDAASMLSCLHTISQAYDIAQLQILCFEAFLEIFTRQYINKKMEMIYNSFSSKSEANKLMSIVVGQLIIQVKAMIAQNKTSSTDRKTSKQEAKLNEFIEATLSNSASFNKKLGEGDELCEEYHRKVVENQDLIKYLYKKLDKIRKDSKTPDWKNDQSVENMVDKGTKIFDEMKQFVEGKAHMIEYYRIELKPRSDKIKSLTETSSAKYEEKIKNAKEMHKEIKYLLTQASSTLQKMGKLEKFFDKLDADRNRMRESFSRIMREAIGGVATSNKKLSGGDGTMQYINESGGGGVAIADQSGNEISQQMKDQLIEMRSKIELLFKSVQKHEQVCQSLPSENDMLAE